MNCSNLKSRWKNIKITFVVRKDLHKLGRARNASGLGGELGRWNFITNYNSHLVDNTRLKLNGKFVSNACVVFHNDDGRKHHRYLYVRSIAACSLKFLYSVVKRYSSSSLTKSITANQKHSSKKWEKTLRHGTQSWHLRVPGKKARKNKTRTRTPSSDPQL